MRENTVLENISNALLDIAYVKKREARKKLQSFVTAATMLAAPLPVYNGDERRQHMPHDKKIKKQRAKNKKARKARKKNR